MNSEFDFLEGNQSSSPTPSIDPILILVKVARRWPIFILATLLGVLVAFMYHRYTTEKFQVRGTIMIPEKSTTLMNNSDLLGDLFSGFNANFLNEIEIVRSERVTREAIQELDFGTEYYSRGRIKSVEEYRSLPFTVIKTLQHLQVKNKEFKISFFENNQFRVTLAEDENHLESELVPPNSLVETDDYSFIIFFTNSSINLEGREFYFTFRDIEYLVNQWNSRLNVTYLKEFTTIAVLTMTHSHPLKASTFLNQVMEVYKSKELERKNETADKTIAYIDRELKMLDDTLSIYESQMDAFKIENRVTNYDQVGDRVTGKLNRLELEKRMAEAGVRSLKENLKFLEDSTQYQEAYLPSTIENASSLEMFINTLQTTLIERDQKLEFLEEFNPQIVRLNVQINSMVDLIKNTAQVNLAQLEQEIVDIDKELKSANLEFRDYPEKQREFSDIERIYGVYFSMFEFFRQRRAEAGIGKARNEANAQIVDRANSNVSAIYPNKSMNYTIGAVVGFLLPLLLVILKEVLNDKIEYRKQVEQLTTIPIIGMIGHNQNDNNLPVLENTKGSLAEGFRSIRSNLDYFNRDKKIKRILLTSNASGEGKSFCSMNLASVLAITGKKTLLVGLDLRKPKLFDDFGYSNDIGMSNYLAGFVQKKDIIKHTEYENLDLILAGPVPPNPGELLMNDGLKELLDDLDSKYDYIVIDTPPIGIVSDTFSLTEMADLNIIVLRQNYTVKSVLKFFNDFFVTKPHLNTAILLNDFKTGATYGYGYGYGYGNGYGYGAGYYEDEDKSENKGSILKSIFKKN